MKAVLLILMVLFLVVACDQKSSEPLTEDQKQALEQASANNVSLYGAPPLIPKDHPIEIGEDVSQFENGGEICLECHNDAENEEAPQTGHPERNNCLQCHVTELDDDATAEDFKIENTFEKHVPDIK
ncbi:MAG: hypothetical protein KAR42_07405 [candidate division Zixibacteria bacterium]|nr:hypothetical protein [candidate division Zixibacteria bacterium]